MLDKKPTHDQAQLLLQLYDLRREAKLRQAREWFTQNYFVDSLEDSNRIAAPASQEGYVRDDGLDLLGLLNHGLLHEQLFFETAGEFFAVWERVMPIVPAIREKYRMNHFLTNLEKPAQRFEKWVEELSPGALEAMREYSKQMRSAKAQKASAAAN